MMRAGTMVALLGALGVMQGAGAQAEAPAPTEDKAIKIAVLDIRAKGSVDQTQVEGLSSLLASEVAALGRYTVITGSDLQEMLGFEAKQQLLGCTEGTSCLAEIGGALGVDFLLSTEVSQVGSTWLLTLVLLDIGNARAVARLTRKTSEEGLVDTAAALVREILSPDAPASTGAGATTEATAESSAATPPRSETPPADPPAATTLDLGLNLQPTLALGLSAQLELPGRIQLALGLGFLPQLFAKPISAQSISSDELDLRYKDARDVLQSILRNQAVLSLSVGWRPAASLGLEVSGGYVLLIGGYSKAETAVIARAYTPFPVPTGVPGEVDVKGTVHAFHLSAGWRFDLGRFVLRPRAGWMAALAAESDLFTQSPILNNAFDGSDIHREMTSDLTRTRTFHLGLTFGYRLF